MLGGSSFTIQDHKVLRGFISMFQPISKIPFILATYSYILLCLGVPSAFGTPVISLPYNCWVISYFLCVTSAIQEKIFINFNTHFFTHQVPSTVYCEGNNLRRPDLSQLRIRHDWTLAFCKRTICNINIKMRDLAVG